jgi:hypothetical protein
MEKERRERGRRTARERGRVRSEGTARGEEGGEGDWIINNPICYILI